MRQIGTHANVIEVLERFEDGRLNIVVEGGGRFQLVEVTDGRSFATAEVEPLEDDGEQATREELDGCLAAYERVVEAAQAELDEIDRKAPDVAYQIASRVDLGVDVKQSLLELRSERDRVRMLSPLLERAADAVRREREVRERARTNGHVDRG
jgi:Lon protease-like protein